MIRVYDLFLIFIAIFVPPVSLILNYVFNIRNCTKGSELFSENYKSKYRTKYKKKYKKQILVNCLLFVVGFFPSLIHALYVISRYTLIEEQDAREEQERLGLLNRNSHSTYDSTTGRVSTGSSTRDNTNDNRTETHVRV